MPRFNRTLQLRTFAGLQIPKESTKAVPGREFGVSPFSGGSAGVELMATHDSGCCVFDDTKVIRDLANQLLSVADAAESAQGVEK